MTLYELDRDIRQLLEEGFSMSCIDMETGEIDEEKAKRYLDELPIERERKLEAYGITIKNYLAEVEAIKEEQQRLAARRKSKEAQIERLKNAVATSLQLNEEKKFETAKVVFSFRKSEAIEIPDLDKLGKAYKRKKVEWVADKAQIKEAIKQGLKVKGATLVTSQNLQVK